MAKIPTVKIVADGELGYRIINRDEFDPEVHEEFQEGQQQAEDEPEPEKPVSQMNKGELVAYAEEEHGVELDPEMLKKEMLKAINDLEENG